MRSQRLRLTAERMEDRLVPAGALDATFEADGVSLVDFAGVEDVGRAVAVQPDGRIVAVGSGEPNKNFVVARFNPDGTDDTSFSDDGKAVVSFGAADHATAVAIQPDGRIVIAGYTDAGGDNDFAIVRLTADGQLDNTFSTDGKVTIGFGDDDRAARVILDGTNIVVVGSWDGGSAHFALVRLTADGSLDNSFSTDGKQTVTFGAADFATSVALQNGKYVVAGYTDASGSDQFAVTRLNADGSLDNTFSGDGKQTIDFGINAERATAVAIDGANIVVVGSIVSAASSNFGIARLTADGSLDNSFSFDGKQSVTFGSADYATSVVIQGDGRIVVGGYTDFLGDNDFAVARLEADGSFDDTFNGIGKAAADFPGEQQAFALALQPDGRIVMAGSTNIFAGDLDLAVVRFAGDTAGLTVSVTDGVGSVTAGGPVSYTILVSNAGPDLVTGAQLASLVPAGLTGVTYVSVSAGGAIGNTAVGAGAIADLLTLPAGSSVAYTVSGVLSPVAAGTQDTTA
ncbi:MAG TPA: hypothetical protein VM597_26550, partial [Gemmataceae bacterium]|nr:hypothetical protein [Gemmataceae bacterium]